MWNVVWLVDGRGWEMWSDSWMGIDGEYVCSWMGVYGEWVRAWMYIYGEWRMDVLVESRMEETSN